MGRKLTALEEFQALSAGSNEDRLESQAERQQQYLTRIADTLGITTAQLSDIPDPSSTAQPMIDIARQHELVLTQQCAELIKAFVQIQDPHKRLHYLKIIRDATMTK